jgi:hypothetical protein
MSFVIFGFLDVFVENLRRLHFDFFSRIWSKQLIDGVIDETSFKLYGSLTELCNDTFCYQETGNFHAKDCIERSCDQCGVTQDGIYSNRWYGL